MSEHGDDLVRRAKVRLGTVVDEKWRIDSLLGLGGMAAVYAATHRNGKRAAIKVLHPEIALNANIKARFLREGWVANKVEHPGAVSVLDDDEAADGTVFLVMELLEGETLETKIRYEMKLPVGNVLALADQLLDVLAAAHANNIVHRDLKPGNLFLTRDGTLKVLDFGIARLRELSKVAVPNATTMSSMGTPGFMPPEQARGRWEEVDARADIFAVGATMFNLLTGRYVHEEETMNEQMLASMTQPACPIRSVLPDLPEAVAAVIDRALAFHANDRWPDARSMQQAVSEAYLAATGSALSMSHRMLVVSRSSRHDIEDAIASAPTLGVDDSGQAQALPSRPSATSSKPMMVTPVATAPTTLSAGQKRRGLLWIGGAAALFALLAVLGITRASARRASGSTATPAAISTSTPLPTPAPSADPSAAATPLAPAAPSTVASAVRAPPTAAPLAPAQLATPRPAPKPTSAPTVDIFGRRR